MRSLLVAAGLLGFMLSSSAMAVDMPVPRTLTLTASADVKVAPNIAYLSIAVTTQAMSAKDAVAQNATKMKLVIDALQKALGTTGKLQTGNYQVTPSYQYDQNTRKSSLTGYEANNSIQVQTVDLSSVGTLIDIATGSGANQIQSVQFSRADMDAVTMQATVAAIQQAKADAAQMAAAAGVTLGNILTISTTPAVGPLYKTERMMMATAADTQTPIVPGEITVSSTVLMSFGL